MEPHPNHTQTQILFELRKAGGIQRISALAELLDISGETVRRNVKRLVDMGVVGKIPRWRQAHRHEEPEEGNLQDRLSLNQAAKSGLPDTSRR